MALLVHQALFLEMTVQTFTSCYLMRPLLHHLPGMLKDLLQLTLALAEFLFQTD